MNGCTIKREDRIESKKQWFRRNIIRTYRQRSNGCTDPPIRWNPTKCNQCKRRTRKCAHHNAQRNPPIASIISIQARSRSPFVQRIVQRRNSNLHLWCDLLSLLNVLPHSLNPLNFHPSSSLFSLHNSQYYCIINTNKIALNQFTRIISAMQHSKCSQDRMLPSSFTDHPGNSHRFTHLLSFSLPVKNRE